MSRAAPRDSQNSEIRIKRAYETFDNDARNDWLEHLQQKIRKGLNPPDDPGPSRSPSPFEVADGVTTSQTVDLENLHPHAQQDHDDELDGVITDEDGEMEYDDEYEDENQPILRDSNLDTGISGPSVGVIVMDSSPQLPSLVAPLSFALQEEALPVQSDATAFSAPAAVNGLEFEDAPLPPIFAFPEDIIDPELLTSLAQQLDPGVSVPPIAAEEGSYAPEGSWAGYYGAGEGGQQGYVGEDQWTGYDRTDDIGEQDDRNYRDQYTRNDELRQDSSGVHGVDAYGQDRQSSRQYGEAEDQYRSNQEYLRGDSYGDGRDNGEIVQEEGLEEQDELGEDDGGYPLEEYPDRRRQENDFEAELERRADSPHASSSVPLSAIAAQHISLLEEDDELLDDRTEESYEVNRDRRARLDDDELDEDEEEEDEEEVEEEEEPPRRSQQAPQVMRRTGKPEVIEVSSDSDEEDSSRSGSGDVEGDEEDGEESGTGEEETEEEEEEIEEVGPDVQTARKPFPPRVMTRYVSPSQESDASSRESSEGRAEEEEPTQHPANPTSPNSGHIHHVGDDELLPADGEEDELASRSPTPPLIERADLAGTPGQPIEFNSDSEDESEANEPGPKMQGVAAEDAESDEEDEEDFGEDEEDDEMREDGADEEDELDSDPESPALPVRPEGIAAQHVYFQEEDELIDDQLTSAPGVTAEEVIIESVASASKLESPPANSEDAPIRSPTLTATVPSSDPSTAPLSPSSPVVQPHHAPPIASLLSIPTAEEEEEQLEEMTVEIDETKHQPIRLGHEDLPEPGSGVDKDGDVMMEAAPNLDDQVAEEEQRQPETSDPDLVEDKVAGSITVQDEQAPEPIDVEQPQAEDASAFIEDALTPAAAEPSTSSRTNARESHQHRKSPAPLISLPTAEEEDQVLDDMAGHEASHQPIMIDDEADIPMPFALPEKEEDVAVQAVSQRPQPEEDTLNTSNVRGPSPVDEEPVNMGFADYILQPPAHPDPILEGFEPAAPSSPVPMSLIDNLPAKMSESRDYRDMSPIPLPDPSAPAPDTDMPSAIEAGDMPFRATRSPSTEAVAPENPPPADMSVDTIQQTESPIVLPDPQAAPPDTSLPAPILPQDLEPSDQTPTGSVIVEAPNETPMFGGPVSESAEATPRPRAETPTALPDPRLAPEDARLPMPDVPLQAENDASVPASLIVNVAPIEEQTSFAGPSSAPTPPRLIVRDFGLLFQPITFATPTDGPSVGSQLLAVEPSGDSLLLTPASEMEVDLAVAEDEPPTVPKAETEEGEAGEGVMEGQDTEEGDGIRVEVTREVSDGDGEDVGMREQEGGLTEAASEVLEEGEMEDADLEDGEIGDVGADAGISDGEKETQNEAPESFAPQDEMEVGGAEHEEGEVIEEAKESSPEHEPLRHHHHGSVTPTPEDPFPSSSAAPRQTRRYARGSLATTETAVTRSHCGYRKLRIVENDVAANVLVPQCVLGDTDRMAQEESADLGVPSVEEEKEARLQRITHQNPLLSAGLAAKLHRVAGASIFDDGHCFLLSASPGGRAVDEDRQTAPQGTPRRISRGRQSGQGATPRIVLDAAASSDAEGAGKSPRTRTTRRSISRLSDVVAPAPSASPIGPKRSIRHSRSGSRLSQVSSERETTPVPPASPAMNTRARSAQPVGPSESSTSLRAERDSTPVPAAPEASIATRRSARLSMSVGSDLVELPTEPIPRIPTHWQHLNFQTLLSESSQMGMDLSSTIDSLAIPDDWSIPNLWDEEPGEPLAESSTSTMRARPKTIRPRRSILQNGNDLATYRPSSPELAAEASDDAEESESAPVPSQAEASGSTASPVALGTRKRGIRFSMDEPVVRVESSTAAVPRRETRSGKRKAEADAEDSQGATNEGDASEQVEEEEKVTKKKRRGWKSFLGL